MFIRRENSKTYFFISDYVLVLDVKFLKLRFPTCAQFCKRPTEYGFSGLPNKTYTVNVDIFAEDIFSRISRRASDARKFDVSENYNHNRTNRNKQHMRENLTAQICLIGLDARKFSCAKISTFTVVAIYI